MKKIKILILSIITIILLSGCTATNTISFSDDGKVNESVSIFEDNLKVLYGNYGLEDSVNLTLEEYKPALNIRKYDYEVVTRDEESGVIINNSYDDICELFNNTVFSQYIYKGFTCSEDKYYYTVESKGEFITFDNYYSTWKIPETMYLKIDFPFTLESHNADSKNNNTYTWKFDEDTSANKTVKFKISKEKINKEKQIIEENIKKQKTKKKVIKYSLIMITLIAIIISSVFIGKVLYKKYKNNQIDY